jgi:hypothetical protein
MPPFDGRLTRLEPFVPFVPGRPVFVQRCQPVLNVALLVFQFRQLALQALLTFGERFLANFRQLLGSRFGGRLAFDHLLLARGDQFCPLV